MAFETRVPCVMETARQARYSMDTVPGSQTPTGVPVGVVDDVCSATPGTPGGDATEIGDAFIIPSVKVCSVGDSFLLEADYTGNNQVGITYTWTITANAGSNVFQPLTAAGLPTGSTTATPSAQDHNKIQFNCVSATTAGSDVTVQVSIASSGTGAASDTPQTATATVTINA